MAKNQIPRPNESDEQIALFEWVGYQLKKYPELGLLYHIPNGGHRHATTARRLKAEGVKAGVPDVCLPVARGAYHGLYIEMKAGKNKPTQNQERWLNALDEQGYYTAVCVGWEVAAAIILKYLEGGDLP